jgi:hypothetical protein
MSRKLHPIFEEIRQKRLCEIVLDFKRAPSVEGFVVGWSDSLVLLQQFNREAFRLNGFCAVGLRFIKSLNHSHSDGTWEERALRKQRQKPVVPGGIDLSGWLGLVESIGRSGQWFSLDLDGKRPGEFFVSQWLESKKTSVRLLDIGPLGEAREPWSIRLSDITRIRWDDGYTRALADTVAA